MIIDSLKLWNFRNYSKLEISISPLLNIIIGDNAEGKTNILEAIYVLAITKSLISNNEADLIKFGEEFLKIKGNLVIEKKKKELELVVTKHEKKVKINGNKITKLSDYISKMNIIFFGPNDLRIIKDSPTLRRKFLNIEMSQLSSNYLKILNEYNHLLKNRNEFLKLANKMKKYDKLYLDIINEKYSSLCIDIMFERKKFLDQINNKIDSIYSKITGFKNLKIRYVSVIDFNDKKNDMKIKLLKKVEDNIVREINYKTSLIGIHRDDFIFELDGRDMSLFSSQGQQRVAVLAFKISELEIFKEISGSYPILLLDDIFSELDVDKCNNLIDFINGNLQVIITTTDINCINKNLVENAKIFKIKNGKVEEEKDGKK